jgi:hypothetical protein
MGGEAATWMIGVEATSACKEKGSWNPSARPASVSGETWSFSTGGVVRGAGRVPQPHAWWLWSRELVAARGVGTFVLNAGCVWQQVRV